VIDEIIGAGRSSLAVQPTANASITKVVAFTLTL
jgi:hypothetical protein